MTALGNYRDRITSHLREDMRIRASVLAMRRIYSNFLYDIYLCIYCGLMDSKSHGDDLVTCLIVCREEKLRIMFKLWTTEIRGNRQEYIASAVKRLTAEGKTPFSLVRDAKTWVKEPFTLKDRAALRMAGIDLPRPPKSPE